MQENSFDFKAHAALVGANLFYGINYVIAKEVTPQFLSPFSLVGFRITGAVLLFNLAFQFFSNEKVNRADIPRLIFCSFTGICANISLFIKGLSLTSPINASLIMITVPMLVLTFSAIFLKEKLTNAKIFGVLLGAIGAILLIIGTNSKTGNASLPGDLMIFMNACSYSIYVVSVKPLMLKYKPITVLRWIFGLGFVLLLPIIYPVLSVQSFEAIPLPIWAATAYVVVFVTFFTYLLNIFALKRVQASVMSIYIYTQPVIASTIAVLSGKYGLQWEHFIASLFIFTGIVLISRPKKAESLA